MSARRPRCSPYSVFCRRCLQAAGDGCRDLTRRAGQFAAVPLYPVGIVHGCRIEDAEKNVLAIEIERNAPPCQDWNVRPTFLRSSSALKLSTKSTANAALPNHHARRYP